MSCLSKSHLPQRLSRVLALVFIIGLVIAGCTNPYMDSYQSLVRGIDVERSPQQGDEMISIDKSEDLAASVKGLLADGYSILGVSAFIEDDVDARWRSVAQFGREQKAEKVVVWDALMVPRTKIIPSGLPPRFCRAAGADCADTRIEIPRRAYVAVALQRVTRPKDSDSARGGRTQETHSDTVITN